MLDIVRNRLFILNIRLNRRFGDSFLDYSIKDICFLFFDWFY